MAATIAAMAAVAGSIAAASASAQAAPRAVDRGTESITLILKSPDAAKLKALAFAHNLDHAQRVARVMRLVPDQAEHASVRNFLKRNGFNPSSETSWTVDATASQSLIATVFGTRPQLPAKPTTADFAAATGPLSVIPASLRPDVAAVFPTFGGPKAEHALAENPLNGSDFRDAYTSPAVSTPYAGTDSNGPLTVATLQLSNWSSGDLKTYASDNGLSLGKHQYTQVNVKGGTTDTSGDDEVALDQESILSTSPNSNQQAYVATNSDAGVDEILSAVFDDVTGNKHATAPNPKIAALSSSWGECESDEGAASIKAEEPLLESLVAAGVTVFSAAGDAGIYDCEGVNLPILGASPLPTTQADVDFPGSSPVVVSVGGTNLQSKDATPMPNTGSNWTETSWSCTDAISCETQAGTGGGGGGESGEASGSSGFKGFKAPKYQKKYVTDTPFAGAPNRLVPDIAADADPSTGFDIYSSDPTVQAECGSPCQVGGTSLATPVSAALLTNTLAHFGLSSGVGDIHDAIYSKAASDAGSIRDVTSGTNGSSGNLTTAKDEDPSVSAQVGFDTNSGVGGVLWPEMASALISSPPVVTAHARLADPTAKKPSKYNRIRVSWGVAESSDGSPAVSDTDVTVTDADTGTAVSDNPGQPANGAMTFEGTPGTTYTISVTGKDSLGHTKIQEAHVTVPLDDTAFHLHGKGWRNMRINDAFAHTLAITTSVAGRASHGGYGKNFYLDVVCGPTLGKLKVIVDGHAVKTIDEYTPSVTHTRVKIFHAASDGIHKVTLISTGKKNPKSTGRTVDFDDLYAVA